MAFADIRNNTINAIDLGGDKTAEEMANTRSTMDATFRHTEAVREEFISVIVGCLSS